jgi:hypothetical protein
MTVILPVEVNFCAKKISLNLQKKKLGFPENNFFSELVTFRKIEKFEKKKLRTI